MNGAGGEREWGRYREKREDIGRKCRRWALNMKVVCANKQKNV